MIMPFLQPVRPRSGPLTAMAEETDRAERAAREQALAVPQHERPFSLASLARPTLPGRCTARPDCAIAATCAATPTMRRACERAFRDWMRRGVATEPPQPRPETGDRRS